MTVEEFTPTTRAIESHYIGVPRELADTHPRTAERAAEFKRWLAHHDAEVRAEAWQEGYDTGTGDGRYSELTLNPYRETEAGR